MRFTVDSDHYGSGEFCARLSVHVRVDYWGYDDLQITDENGHEVQFETLDPIDQKQITDVIEDRITEARSIAKEFHSWLRLELKRWS